MEGTWRVTIQKDLLASRRAQAARGEYNMFFSAVARPRGNANRVAALSEMGSRLHPDGADRSVDTLQRRSRRSPTWGRGLRSREKGGPALRAPPPKVIRKEKERRRISRSCQ